MSVVQRKRCAGLTQKFSLLSSVSPFSHKFTRKCIGYYGHFGIVEAARDLYQQIDGTTEKKEFQEGGLLTSLLGDGCECEGYNLRIVGHSLGGAIAAMLGLKLYKRYPRLHVYSYGPLPCVDSVLANACSRFVTSEHTGTRRRFQCLAQYGHGYGSSDDDDNDNDRRFSSNRNSNPYYESANDGTLRVNLISKFMEAMPLHEKEESHDNNFT